MRAARSRQQGWWLSLAACCAGRPHRERERERAGKAMFSHAGPLHMACARRTWLLRWPGLRSRRRLRTGAYRGKRRKRRQRITLGGFCMLGGLLQRGGKKARLASRHARHVHAANPKPYRVRQLFVASGAGLDLLAAPPSLSAAKLQKQGRPPTFLQICKCADTRCKRC